MFVSALKVNNKGDYNSAESSPRQFANSPFAIRLQANTSAPRGPLWAYSVPYSRSCCTVAQWRRQDLLRGGAMLEIMSWGTHGGLQGRVQQLLDD